MSIVAAEQGIIAFFFFFPKVHMCKNIYSHFKHSFLSLCGIGEFWDTKEGKEK